MEQLKEKTQLGIIYGFFTSILTQALQFIFGIVLARILTPQDYGLTGMLAIFVALSQTFVDSGLGTAILRKKEPTNLDYSTVFWYNLLVALLFYFLLFFLSPLIANFYNDLRLIPLTKVISIVIIIDAFGSIQGKYLNKNLEYNKLNKVYIIAFVGSSILAVILAIWGFGVWALVGKSLIQSVMLNFGWWISSKWKPSFVFSGKSFRELSNFGTKILATSLFTTFFSNIYSILIGKFYSAQSLGYFTRAKQFYELPDRFIRSSSMGIFFPALSHIQDDDEKLLKSYKQILSLLAFILFPIYLILALIANPLINILLTEKWIDSVIILQLLCFSALTMPFESINENILYIKGKSNYIFYSTIFRKIALLFLVWFFSNMNLIGIVIAIVLEAFCGVTITSYFSRKLFNYNLLKQIKDIIPILLNNIIILIILVVVSYFIDSNWLKLIVLPLLGFGIYYFIGTILNKNEIHELSSVFYLFLRKIRKRDLAAVN